MGRSAAAGEISGVLSELSAMGGDQGAASRSPIATFRCRFPRGSHASKLAERPSDRTIREKRQTRIFGGESLAGLARWNQLPIHVTSRGALVGPRQAGFCDARRSAEGGAAVGRLPTPRAKSAPGPAEVRSPRTTSAELESNPAPRSSRSVGNVPRPHPSETGRSCKSGGPSR